MLGLPAWRGRRRTGPPAAATPDGLPPGTARPTAPRRSPVGTQAPVVVGVSPTGELSALQPQDGAVIFLTSSCLACRDVWDALGRGDAGTAALKVAAVVTPDATLESRDTVAALAPAGMPTVMSTASWQSYAAAGSPWVAVVMAGLVVAEGSATGWDDLVALVRGDRRGDRPA